MCAVCARARVRACVCVFVVRFYYYYFIFIYFFFKIILYVNCFGRTMLYMCIEYHISVNMYHVSAQGVDERMINVHYYYYYMYLNNACNLISIHL